MGILKWKGAKEEDHERNKKEKFEVRAKKG